MMHAHAYFAATRDGVSGDECDCGRFVPTRRIVMVWTGPVCALDGCLAPLTRAKRVPGPRPRFCRDHQRGDARERFSRQLAVGA